MYDVCMYVWCAIRYDMFYVIWTHVLYLLQSGIPPWNHYIEVKKKSWSKGIVAFFAYFVNPTLNQPVNGQEYRFWRKVWNRFTCQCQMIFDQKKHVWKICASKSYAPCKYTPPPKNCCTSNPNDAPGNLRSTTPPGMDNTAEFHKKAYKENTQSCNSRDVHIYIYIYTHTHAGGCFGSK